MTRITLLQLNDLHGYAQPHAELRRDGDGKFVFAEMGGLARIKAVFDRVRAERDAAGRLWLRPEQVAVAARIQRLRVGLSLNYAAVGLVMDLLDRITELETTLRTRQRSSRWS